MIAILLYVIGLIAVLVSIALVGYSAPALFQTFTTAMDAGSNDMLGVVTRMAQSVAWSVAPIVGGLCLMGLGRMIMLLAAINRSLRGVN